MNKLTNIAKGWFTFANQPVALKGVIEARLNTCDTCDDKVQMNDLAQTVVSIINEEGSTYKCGRCGCPLASATASMPYSCVDKKWRPISPEEEALIMADSKTYTTIYESTISDFDYTPVVEEQSGS